MMTNRGVYGLNVLKLFDASTMPMLGRGLEYILGLFEEKKLRVLVGKTFPMSDAAAAHAYLHSRANVGKVVLERCPATFR